MKLIFTCNGYEKKTYNETVYDLEIAMSDDMYSYITTLLEDKKLNADNTNETVITVLREMSWFNDFIFRHVVGIEKKVDIVYIVQFDYSTEEESGIETSLYHDYYEAYDYYKQLIVNECNADVSWVGEEVFDEDGEVREQFELDCDDNNSGESDVYWLVKDKDNSQRYSYINLFKKEIK